MFKMPRGSRLPLAFAVMAGLSIQSCGGLSNAPSESTARAAFEQQLHEHGNGLVRLVGFTKTNGVVREAGGVETYEMDFTAEVEFIEDADWRWKKVRNDRLVLSAIPHNPRDFVGRSAFGMKSAKKGERVGFAHTMKFERTEKGWRDEDRRIH
jgi:hypothetical protein